MLEIRDLRKSFGQAEVLRGVDLTVRRGEVSCVIGPSGSGKSTLLRCVNHLEKVDSGRIEIDGELVGYRESGGRLRELPDRAVARQRARIGMVFQNFNLFGHLTVLENLIEAPVGVLGLSKVEAALRARDTLRRVGLDGREDAYPRQLSGGQQQRVAIARALAMEPELLLFDEPTSALDPELVGEVLAVMHDLVRAGQTMVVVTHEIGFAREAADSVVFLDGGEIVESGPPGEVLSNPAHARTREFLQRTL
jgi:polar amino acid transport system ATP-binding protein